MSDLGLSTKAQAEPHKLSRRDFGRSTVSVALLFGVAGLTSSCGFTGDERRIRIVVTENAPFQEPSLIAEQLLEEQGWNFEATYVTDIIQPNMTVANGEYDVNFFQNISYLRQFNEDNNLDIEPIFFMFEQPSGIYSSTYDSLADLPNGAQIALPVDTANNGRGIRLLARAGLIEIDESKWVAELSIRDITDNPLNLEFVEVDQQAVGQIYPDVDAVFGFARLLAEIDVMPDEALIIETADEALPFALAICARPGFREQEPEKYQALKTAYHSEEVRQWYGDYLGGLLNPAFDRDIDTAWEDINGR